MFRLSTLSIAVCTLAATAVPSAQAADIIEPIPEVVLRGWYLRGDIGYSNQFVDSLDNALYDAPGVTDVNNLSADFDGAPFFGGGIGYRFNNWFRADISVEG
jgi:opacity protein-like surface antigen